MSEKDKIDNTLPLKPAAPAALAARAPIAALDFSAPSLGAYSKQAGQPEKNVTPEISAEAWEKAKKQAAWKESFAGRSTIRFFSGGVLGSAAFVGADLLVGKGFKHYNASVSFREQKTLFKKCAKAIDNIIGKPIEWAVKTITGDAALAERAVHFRQTNNSYHKIGTTETTLGRPLSSEAFNVSGGFFAYSVADAAGRDIANIIDPNADKSWIDKDKHIDWKKAGKSLGSASWRYVTYHGGEDIAVTLPYIYALKGFRSGINAARPGFAYDFDRNLLGGSFLVDDKGKVNGNMSMAGMAYLQGAFTLYNDLTIHYRELYNYIGKKLAGKPATLVGAPDAETQTHQSKKSLLDKAGDMVKWVARDAIKAVLYMTPTVPFFSLVRSNQRREDGLFIAADGAVLTYNDNAGRRRALTGKDINHPLFTDPNLYREHLDPYSKSSPLLPIMTLDEFREQDKHSFQYKTGRPITDGVAHVNYKATQLLNGSAQWADRHLPGGNAIKEAFDVKDNAGNLKSFSGVTESFTRNLLAYLPYKIAKREFSTLLDTGRMNFVLEDGLSSLAKGDLSGVKRGFSELGRTIVGKKLTDPKREAEAHRREMIDQSPADVHSRTIGETRQDEMNVALAKQAEINADLDWRERLISKKPKMSSAVTDVSADHPEVSPQIKDIIAQGAKNKNRMAGAYSSHADQEALRLALQHAEPLTPSRH